jgi:predicted DNA-binding transcriptional regulator YafY
MDTSVRMLRLLSLLQARGFWPGAELAERLEVTPRTLRRDVDRLRSLGYPVRSSSGVAGGYQLGAGASLPPLLLDDDEAIAVALALRTAAAGTIVGMEEVAVRTLAKLEQVLPARLRQRVTALHDAIVPLHFGGPRVEPRLLSTLAGASRNHERASFRYGDIQARITERTTEPHGLVYTGSRWYLAAWDQSSSDWRTFRVDRILGDVTLGSRFTRRELPYGDVASYVSNSVASRPYPFRARVIFHAPRARVAERIPPLAGHLVVVDDQRCVLETGSHSIDSLALYIAAVGEDFEICEPPELADTMRRLAERLARATAPAC